MTITGLDGVSPFTHPYGKDCCCLSIKGCMVFKMYHWLWRAPFSSLDACSFPCAGGVTSTTGCTTGSTPAGQHTTHPGSSPLPVVHIRNRKQFQDNDFRSKTTEHSCDLLRMQAEKQGIISREGRRGRSAAAGQDFGSWEVHRGGTPSEGLGTGEGEAGGTPSEGRPGARQRAPLVRLPPPQPQPGTLAQPPAPKPRAQPQPRRGGPQAQQIARAANAKVRALKLPSLGRCVCMGDLYGDMMCNPCPCHQQDVLLTPPIAGWGRRASCRLVHCSRNILSASMMILPHWFQCIGCTCSGLHVAACQCAGHSLHRWRT